MYHIPVLLKEVLEYLDPKPGKKYIDATIGEGGHAKEIIRRGGIVLGIDSDPSVIPHLMRDPDLDSRFRGNEIRAVAGNFADLQTAAEENGFDKVSGILFDLGLGSHQLDDSARGFAFQRVGPLDMRYNPEQKVTAAQLLNKLPEKELVKIFYQFGEERRFGQRIARAVLEARKTKNLETTGELFELIKKALPGRLRFRAGNTARKIFQATRIAVNEELENLKRALPQALDLLEPDGRLTVISFHSLEDRIVKNFFAQNAKDCICPPSFPVCRCDHKAQLRILTKKPIVPSEEEIKNNPRSHSAKLRAAQKL